MQLVTVISQDLPHVIRHEGRPVVHLGPWDLEHAKRLVSRLQQLRHPIAGEQLAVDLAEPPERPGIEPEIRADDERQAHGKYGRRQRAAACGQGQQSAGSQCEPAQCSAGADGGLCLIGHGDAAASGIRDPLRHGASQAAHAPREGQQQHHGPYNHPDQGSPLPFPALEALDADARQNGDYESHDVQRHSRGAHLLHEGHHAPPQAVEGRAGAKADQEEQQRDPPEPQHQPAPPRRGGAERGQRHYREAEVLRVEFSWIRRPVRLRLRGAHEP